MQTKMIPPVPTLGCPPGTLPGGLTRTRFFDGMFLTQADLENEQIYWRMKRRLTNRALGAGVVWGLRLTFDLQAQRYRLSPGYALDCCGNDVIVECPVEISQSELFQRSQALLAQPAVTPGSQPSRYIGIQTVACVILQYVECPDGIRPVHRDACSPAGGSCEPSRIRESCRLLLVPRCPDATGCDPLVAFGQKMERVKQQLAGQPATQPPGQPSKSWMPSPTYGDAYKTLGSLLLTGLHGYMATADKNNASAEARVTVSYLMNNVMTGLMDIDVASLTDDLRAQISIAVGQLSSDLCNGLLYPGPRCIDELHGVYLGCVALQNGVVTEFDPWLCRREVLTGPLINWWMCQFGNLPLDVLINQIADWQCGMASATDGTVYKKSDELINVVSDQVTEKQTMTPYDFMSTIARALTGSTSSPGLVRVESTAPNGKPMSIVVPAAAAPSADIGASVAALAQSVLLADRNVQPLSRAPLRDLVTELAARTPVSAVATSADADTVKALGSMTVNDLLAADPEAVLAKIAGAKPSDAQRAAVNQLYTSAEGFVRDAATATSAAGKAGVTRAQLKNTELKTALKKVTGATAGAIDAAVAAAGKR